jgi:hypothetical protein
MTARQVVQRVLGGRVAAEILALVHDVPEAVDLLADHKHAEPRGEPIAHGCPRA